MSGISCGCTLPLSACKTCYNLHPEIYNQESIGYNESHSFKEGNHSLNKIGWVCPICRRGISPKVEQCPCQNK